MRSSLFQLLAFEHQFVQSSERKELNDDLERFVYETRQSRKAVQHIYKGLLLIQVVNLRRPCTLSVY